MAMRKSDGYAGGSGSRTRTGPCTSRRRSLPMVVVYNGKEQRGMKAETVEARAVKIAAFVMHKAGLCRLEDPEDCKRVDLKGGGRMCERCIQSWLLRKAKVGGQRGEDEA